MNTNRTAVIERLARRFREGDGFSVTADFRALFTAISQDQSAQVRLAALKNRPEVVKHGEIPNLMAADPEAFFRRYGFDILTTENERIVFCYAALEGFASLTSEQLPSRLVNNGERIADIAKNRGGGGPVMPAVVAFYKALVEPVVTFLLSSLDLEVEIVRLMLKYKQRTEWFERSRLLNVAQRDEHQVESALKQDFYRFLFDQGIEFTIDPLTPEGTGKPDILAKLLDGNILLVEAKVFDNIQRDIRHVRKGVDQALKYAEQFNTLAAFLLTFNIFDGKSSNGSRLTFAGGREMGNGVASWEKASRTVYIASVDLGVSRPASSASLIDNITVDLL